MARVEGWSLGQCQMGGGGGGGAPLSLPGGQEHDLEKRGTVTWVELQMRLYLELSIYYWYQSRKIKEKRCSQKLLLKLKGSQEVLEKFEPILLGKAETHIRQSAVDSHSKGRGGRRWAQRQEGICLIQGTGARLQWLWLWRAAASWWTSWASPGNSVPFCIRVGVNAIHDFRWQGDDSPVKDQEKGPFICQVLCSGADLGSCEGGPGSGDGHFHTEVLVRVPSSCSLVGSPWVGHFTLCTSISQSIKSRD